MVVLASYAGREEGVGNNLGCLSAARGVAGSEVGQVTTTARLAGAAACVSGHDQAVCQPPYPVVEGRAWDYVLKLLCAWGVRVACCLGDNLAHLAAGYVGVRP